jgi:uncharacterized OB-fold protein
MRITGSEQSDIEPTMPPVPVPDSLTEAYWAGAARQQLVIQRCLGCRRFRHLPTSRCSNCGSGEMTFETVSGRGTIHTYAITFDARTPAFTARQPYAIVTVELDEQQGLFVLTNMPTTSLQQVAIGRRVEVYFESLAEGVWLPQFRLLEDTESN